MIVRPEGSCTLAICGTIGPLLESCRKPAITDLYFDLSAANWLDSTFIGTLLALARMSSDPCMPTVHLVRVAPGILEVLEKMHVVSFFSFPADLPEIPVSWDFLHPQPVRCADVADVVIGAHQTLIDADRRNAPTFRPVIDLFEAQRQRMQELRDRPAPRSNAPSESSEGTPE